MNYSSTTHYPSWGFITTGTRANPQVLMPSLPLMGIHNPMLLAIWNMPLIASLPLMGIHNGLALREVGPGVVLLITPHGDS